VPQYSLRSTRRPVCIPLSRLININASVGNTWKSRGIRRELRVAAVSWDVVGSPNVDFAADFLPTVPIK